MTLAEMFEEAKREHELDNLEISLVKRLEEEGLQLVYIDGLHQVQTLDGEPVMIGRKSLEDIDAWLRNPTFDIFN